MIICKEELKAIPVPEQTKTWRPVAHIDAIDMVAQQIENTGMKVDSERFEVTQHGMIMFAVLKLDQIVGGVQWSIGIRNSHNKWFSLGITGGTNVIVCTNLMFSGEFIDFRRHTGLLTYEEIQTMAKGAMTGLVKSLEKITEWQESLKNIPMPIEEMKMKTFDMMRIGILPPSQFPQFCDSLEEERNLNGDSVYSFHGGMTRMIKDKSLALINDRSASLNNFVKKYVDEIY